MAGELILVVDDEPNIIELARLYLEKEGFRVAEAGGGEEALRLFGEMSPALVVLDIMIPEPDGWEVCRRIRSRSSLPIIMLTAREDEVDKVVGLELGADDYLTKPFSPRELVARVKAVLRRARPALESQEMLHLGDLVIDASRRQVTQGEKEIDLTPREFDLLYTLALNRVIVMSRERRLERVWGSACCATWSSPAERPCCSPSCSPFISATTCSNPCETSAGAHGSSPTATWTAGWK